MRQQGSRASGAARKRRTTIPDEAAAERARDLLQRDFTATRAEREVGRRHHLPAHLDGFVYLAFILDCYSRMIVGWQLATHMRTELVLDALEMANGAAPASGRPDRALRSRLAVHEPRPTPTGSTSSGSPLGRLRAATPTTTRWPKPGSRPSRPSSSTARRFPSFEHAEHETAPLDRLLQRRAAARSARRHPARRVRSRALPIEYQYRQRPNVGRHLNEPPTDAGWISRRRSLSLGNEKDDPGAGKKQPRRRKNLAGPYSTRLSVVGGVASQFPAEGG